MRSLSNNGFFLSNSCISIAKVSSFVTPPGFRIAPVRIAVIDWATVSAMPPSTAFVTIIVSTAKGISLIILVLWGKVRTRSIRIIAIELRHQPRNDSHFYEEYNEVYDR